MKKLLDTRKILIKLTSGCQAGIEYVMYDTEKALLKAPIYKIPISLILLLVSPIKRLHLNCIFLEHFLIEVLFEMLNDSLLCASNTYLQSFLSIKFFEYLKFKDH